MERQINDKEMRESVEKTLIFSMIGTHCGIV